MLPDASPASSHLASIAAVVLAFLAVSANADGSSVRWPSPNGRAAIAKPFAGSEIVVSASARTAGAIDSLTWNGREFLNSFDHGRELQSAASFDGFGECLNPCMDGSCGSRISIGLGELVGCGHVYGV